MATLKNAVANLLRLTNSDIKDAELLSAGRYPDSASLLIYIGARRLLETVCATEHGWPVPSDAIDLDTVPDENPLKLALMRISKLMQQPTALTLLPDGHLPKKFDLEAFRSDVKNVRKLLLDMSGRFGVDLFGNGPAERAVAARTEPVPKPKQPGVRPKLRGVPPASNIPRQDPKPSKTVPPAKETRHPPIFVSDTRPKRHVLDAPQPVKRRSLIASSPNHKGITSATFWALMDRWQVSDLAALALIGHRGGLSKEGLRPRFKLVGEEAKMVYLAFEIDQTLRNIGLDPKMWVAKSIKATPFTDSTPVVYLAKNGVKGFQEVGRYLLKNGLNLSIAST